MAKMTVAEAAAHFNVSREAIHNRVRRGSLKSVIENGVKYVIVEEVKEPQASHADQRYYDYIEEENARLRERVHKLENETTSLRDKREASLIAEREKIEQIYKERDAQLKSVLQVVASKFLTHQNMDAVIEEVVAAEEEEESLDDVIDVIDVEDDIVSLKQFLKLKMFSKKKREKIKARFEKYAFDDDRIIMKQEKIYLKPNHFDYSDLIK